MGGTKPIRLRRPGYQPRWEGSIEGWARNYVAANHWRVAATLEFDDAVQECALVFARCCRAYTGTVDNPRWFMALYKIAVVNAFTNLAEKNRRHLVARGAAVTEHTAAVTLRPPVALSEGPLLTALGEASSELRQVLTLALVTAPQELAGLMLTRRPSTAWSRALCRWARLPTVRSDLIIELKRLLGGPT